MFDFLFKEKNCAIKHGIVNFETNNKNKNYKIKITYQMQTELLSFYKRFFFIF